MMRIPNKAHMEKEVESITSVGESFIPCTRTMHFPDNLLPYTDLNLYTSYLSIWIYDFSFVFLDLTFTEENVIILFIICYVLFYIVMTHQNIQCRINIIMANKNVYILSFFLWWSWLILFMERLQRLLSCILICSFLTKT